jgi:hypothetical protein
MKETSFIYEKEVLYILASTSATLTLQLDTDIASPRRKGGSTCISCASIVGIHVPIFTAGPIFFPTFQVANKSVERKISSVFHEPIRGSYEKGLVILLRTLTAGSTLAFHVPAFQGL